MHRLFIYVCFVFRENIMLKLNSRQGKIFRFAHTINQNIIILIACISFCSVSIDYTTYDIQKSCEPHT